MEIARMTVSICPSEESMAAIIALLNLWQDAHPDLMVALVPAEDRYQYEIIKSGRPAKSWETRDGQE